VNRYGMGPVMAVDCGRCAARYRASAPGGAKTKVTGLIAHFFGLQQAAVLVDGSDLRKVTRSWVASQLGVVFRDTFLFDASVADNLR
jgi:ATP-binding cassette, subfamily B, bacterial IrtB/YbtQ